MPCIIEDLDKSTAALDKHSVCQPPLPAAGFADGRSCDKSCQKSEVIRKHSQVSPAARCQSDCVEQFHLQHELEAS